MKIKITVGSETTITAIDLIGDAWHDHVHHLDQAKQSHSNGDSHATNRAIRAALTTLISHLDGVISRLYETRILTDSAFRPTRRRDGGSCTLLQKIGDIRRHAKERKAANLPYFRSDFKLLRDILMHPSITKRTTDDTGKTVELSDLDLYDVTVSQLISSSRQIDRWLQQACSIYSFTRIHDTKQACIDLADKLGELRDEPLRI